MRELLDEVAERVDALAAGRGVGSGRPRLAGGAWLVGDRRRLAQVLTNLTTNATRHTPPGGRSCYAPRWLPTARWSSA